MAVTEAQLKAMTFHQTLTGVTDEIEVTRVRGGWIYKITKTIEDGDPAEEKDRDVATCFVPYFNDIKIND